MMAVAMVCLRYCRSPGSEAPATLQVLNIKRLRITKNERSEFINPTHRRIPLQCVGDWSRIHPNDLGECIGECSSIVCTHPCDDDAAVDQSDDDLVVHSVQQEIKSQVQTSAASLIDHHFFLAKNSF